MSCPHAHQQNGSAERKHRHIVKVGLALLAQASMPLKFWDEAFFTASYLINRTPSKVIKFETPLERLFHQKPNYQFLRIFWCACWPNLRPYNNHQLQFRSKQCAFLGYSHLHKGFKCLDICTGRVYISRDVIFDKNVFPFANLHSNAGARLRSEISLLPSSLVPYRTHQGGEQGSDHVFNNAPANSVSGENAATGNDAASNGEDSGILGSVDEEMPHGPEPEQDQIDGTEQDHVDGTATDSPDASAGHSPAHSGHMSPQGALDHVQLSTDHHGDAGGSTGAESHHNEAIDQYDVTQDAAPTGATRPKTRLQSGVRKEKVYTDGVQ